MPKSMAESSISVGFASIDLATADFAALVQDMDVDLSVPPVQHTVGGSSAGYARWRAWIASGGLAIGVAPLKDSPSEVRPATLTAGDAQNHGCPVSHVWHGLLARHLAAPTNLALGWRHVPCWLALNFLTSDVSVEDSGHSMTLDVVGRCAKRPSWLPCSGPLWWEQAVDVVT